MPAYVVLRPARVQATSLHAKHGAKCQPWRPCPLSSWRHPQWTPTDTPQSRTSNLVSEVCSDCRYAHLRSPLDRLCGKTGQSQRRHAEQTQNKSPRLLRLRDSLLNGKGIRPVAGPPTAPYSTSTLCVAELIQLPGLGFPPVVHGFSPVPPEFSTACSVQRGTLPQDLDSAVAVARSEIAAGRRVGTFSNSEPRGRRVQTGACQISRGSSQRRVGLPRPLPTRGCQIFGLQRRVASLK